jgi:L-rhamnose mutarotase
MPSDFRLRAWGMFLQLLGAYTVWHDLTGTAREFKVDGILRRNWHWIKAGFGFPTIASVSTDLTCSYSISAGRACARPTIDENASFNQRITALESYVKHIDNDVAGAFTEISQQKRDLSAKIDEKAGALHAVIRETETRLKNALVGNYSVLLFGAAWLFFGIVLSSVAPEIAKLVAGQYQQVWQTM